VQCKNYRAYTMAEAMAAVKSDLGADAIVLHTRSLTQGGFLGIGRRTVIEITAARAEGVAAGVPARGTRQGQQSSGAASAPATSIANGQRSLAAPAATRAYASGGRSPEVAFPAPSAKADAASDPDIDRNRTRLLAQAIAVKLEREQAELPRTGATTAASANAAATAKAALQSVAPATVAQASAASDVTTVERAATSQPSVAQRFVLIPASEAARAAERQALVQRVSPNPSGENTIRARVELERRENDGPVANRPLSIAPVKPTAPTERTETAAIAKRVAPTVAPIVTVDEPVDAPRAVNPVAFAVAPAPRANDAGHRAPEGIDLDAIGRLVDEVLRRPNSPGVSDGVAQRTRTPRAESHRPQRLETLYANLLGQDVGNELAEAIVTDLQASLTPDELASDHAVRSAATQRIAALLPRCGALEPLDGAVWRRNGRALTVAFIGPTGVGKTTTVAKIAASLKLRYGARVGLITCDTYRIAAVDQLRTYADIIGLPLEIVLSPGQMRQARQRLDELDVVLIDTAGRSQNDSDRLGELAAMVNAAEPHETHLVLSSTASEKVLMREAQAFSAVGVDRVVLTKLDEAVGLGAVLRVLRTVGRGVSYLTTGQEVPQHIEAARPGRLAELVLGGVSNA
jgi:flagellar biosynthesis protein FlhF